MFNDVLCCMMDCTNIQEKISGGNGDYISSSSTMCDIGVVWVE